MYLCSDGSACVDGATRDCACVLVERLGDWLWREGWGVCVYSETRVCMWRERWEMCGERGVVCVFVCGETGSEWRDRQGCLCVCGETGVWLWRAEACGARGRCVLGAGLERWGGGERDWAVRVCVCRERHGVGLCGCVCVLEKLGFVCVCVCLERLGSTGIQRQVFVCMSVCRDRVSVEEVCVCIRAHRGVNVELESECV